MKSAISAASWKWTPHPKTRRTDSTLSSRGIGVTPPTRFCDSSKAASSVSHCHLYWVKHDPLLRLPPRSASVRLWMGLVADLHRFQTRHRSKNCQTRAWNRWRLGLPLLQAVVRSWMMPRIPTGSCYLVSMQAMKGRIAEHRVWRSSIHHTHKEYTRTTRFAGKNFDSTRQAENRQVPISSKSSAPITRKNLSR